METMAAEPTPLIAQTAQAIEEQESQKSEPTPTVPITLEDSKQHLPASTEYRFSPEELATIFRDRSKGNERLAGKEIVLRGIPLKLSKNTINFDGVKCSGVTHAGIEWALGVEIQVSGTIKRKGFFGRTIELSDCKLLSVK